MSARFLFISGSSYGGTGAKVHQHVSILHPGGPFLTGRCYSANYFSIPFCEKKTLKISKSLAVQNTVLSRHGVFGLYSLIVDVYYLKIKPSGAPLRKVYVDVFTPLRFSAICPAMWFIIEPGMEQNFETPCYEMLKF